nr:peptidoglycan editing factor PgeF [candidate division Zixibacteria bacterium]
MIQNAGIGGCPVLAFNLVEIAFNPYNQVMFKDYEKSVRLWHCDRLSEYDGILNFVTTRHKGFSQEPYDTLNMGLSAGDNPLRVIRNRELVASILGIEAGCFVSSWQEHGNSVRAITRESFERETSYMKVPKEHADAMVTGLPNVCLTVIIADCTPVMFYDPKNNVIGIAHAGWRGTVGKISAEVVTVLHDRFGCQPGDLVVGIGPSIGPEKYEVGPEVITEAEKSFGTIDGLIRIDKKSEKGYFDLWEANRRQLIEAGVPENQIEIAGICTYSHPEQFFSYRYQGSKSGRMAAGIMLWE